MLVCVCVCGWVTLSVCVCVSACGRVCVFTFLIQRSQQHEQLSSEHCTGSARLLINMCLALTLSLSCVCVCVTDHVDLWSPKLTVRARISLRETKTALPYNQPP